MLEVLIPTPIANAHLLPVCLEALHENTSVPFRVTVLIDGGLREDFADVESYLCESPIDWRLLHNQPPVYLNRSLEEMLEGLPSPKGHVVVLAPQVILDDEDWVRKWNHVFQVDRRAAMVTTAPLTTAATAPPVRRDRWSVPGSECRLMVLTIEFARAHPPKGEIDPAALWHSQAFHSGHSVWHQPGIRTSCAEHKEHRLWREQSEHRIAE